MMKRTPKTPALAKLAMLLLFAIAAVAILDTTSISAQELGRTITSPFGIARQTSASESGTDGDTFVDPETGEVGHIIRNPFGVANPEGVDTGIDIPDNGEEVGGVITNPFGVPASDDIDTGVDTLDEDEEYLISLPLVEGTDTKKSEDVDKVDDETSDDAKELEEESAGTTTEKVLPVIDNPIPRIEGPTGYFYLEGISGEFSVTSDQSQNGSVPTLYVLKNANCTITAYGEFSSGNMLWLIKKANSTFVNLSDQTGSDTYNFTADTVQYGRTYMVLCRTTGDDPQECAIRISIVDGIKVFDPKLEGFTAPQYTVNPEIRKIAICNSQNLVVDTCSVANNGHFSWNGRWGKNINGTDTEHKGKYADPGKYSFCVIKNNNVTSEIVLSVFIVRLGITEIEFQGENPGEFLPICLPRINQNWFPTTHSEPLPIDSNGNLSEVRWRIGDEQTDLENADITIGPNIGNRREHINPSINYGQNNNLLSAPNDNDSSNELENDTWNLPVCYKKGSKIQINVKTSPAAYSKVLGRSIGSNDLGFNEFECPNIQMIAKIGNRKMEYCLEDRLTRNQNEQTIATSPNISPGKKYTFKECISSVGQSVGCAEIVLDFSWQYELNGNLIDIPGKMMTSHQVFTIIDTPNNPWNNSSLWLAVLYHASNWASGATTLQEASNMITEHVNENIRLIYSSKSKYTRVSPQMPNELHNSYIFACTAFILYLYIQEFSPCFIEDENLVNCSDCAAIVTVFSNALGCNLKIKHLGNNTNYSNYFNLNDTICIGNIQGYTRFKYHAVAVGENDTIWDACLKVSQNPTLQSNNQIWLLPKGIPFNCSSTNPPHGSLPDYPVLASSTSPVLEPSSDSDWTLEITKVYEHPGDDGVVPSICILKCTEVTATSAKFKWYCEKYDNILLGGDEIVLHPMITSFSSCYTKNGIRIFEYKIVRGTSAFNVGKRFRFNLNYIYEDYRSRLAAPDFIQSVFDDENGTPIMVKEGRTRTGTLTTYSNITLQ